MTPRNRQIQSEIADLYTLAEIVNKHRERIDGVLEDAGLPRSEIYTVQCHLSALRMDVIELMEASNAR